MMQILSKHWKNIMLGVMAIALSLSFRECSRNSHSVQVLKNTTDSLHYYKLKNGQIAAQGVVDKMTIKELKEFGGQLGYDNEKLRQQVGKLSNLVAHWKGRAGMRDTIKVELRDTVIMEVDGTADEEKTFAWSNKYLFLDGVIDDGSISISYNYSTEFSITAYNKRQGVFKPKLLVADISFKDPNIQAREFKGFVVTQPKKGFWQTGTGKFLIGAGVGAIGLSLLK